MTWMINADLVIAEDAPGQYEVFAWPNLPPTEAAPAPRGIRAAWRVSGSPVTYFNMKPPPAPLTLEQVRQYLADLRAAGLIVRPTTESP